MPSLNAIARRWIWLLPLALGLAWTSWCGYDGLTGADSNDYLWTAGLWRGWLHGGARPAPAEHPPGFALAGAAFASVIGSTHLAMRLLPILAFAVAGAVLMRSFSADDGQGDTRSVYLLLAFGTSPFLLRYGLVVLSDVPGLALMLLIHACLVRAQATGRVAWYAAAIAFAVGAMSVRYAAVPMLLAAIVFLLWNEVPSALKRPVVLAAALLVLAGGLLVSFPPATWTVFLKSTPLGDWSVLNVFTNEHHSDDGRLVYRFPNIVYVLSIAVHPGFLPIGVLVLPFFRLRDLSGFGQGLAACMLGAYLLFTAGLPFQNDRVMLLALPFLLLLLWPAFVRAWTWLSGRWLRPGWILVLVCLVQSGLFARAMWPFIRQGAMERELAQHVVALGARHVYTHGLTPVLRNRCPQVEVTDLWYAPIGRFEPGALFVVNEGNLREQWQGLHPLENWNSALAQGVERLETRPDGWVFARVR